MSTASKFFFDPLMALIHRALASSSQPVNAQGAAVLNAALDASPNPVPALIADAEATGVKMASDALSGLTSGNSAMGITSTIVGDLENGIAAAVDTLADAYIKPIPFAGEFIDEKAKAAAHAALVMAQNHAMSYMAAKFGWHIMALSNTPTAPAAGQQTLNLDVPADAAARANVSGA